MGAIVIVLVLGWVLSLGGGSDSDQASPEGINWSTADVTSNTVKAALSQKTAAAPVSRDTDFPKNIINIEVIDHAAKPGQKNVHIYFKPGTVWDETDFVKKVGGTAIMAGSILYTNPKLEGLS